MYRIEINTDSAAFEDGVEAEVARILEALAGRVRYGNNLERIVLRDLNGNRCGVAAVANDEEV